MPLDLDLVIDPEVTFAHGEPLAHCLAYAAEHEPRAPRGQWTVTVRLTGDDAIAEFHQQFFRDSSPTDVISFPSDEPLSNDAGYLGDIVVSSETAARQALEVGHSAEREIAFLVLHGFLHLCGYDDPDEPERETMLQRQNELLEGFEATYGRPW